MEWAPLALAPAYLHPRTCRGKLPGRSSASHPALTGFSSRCIAVRCPQLRVPPFFNASPLFHSPYTPSSVKTCRYYISAVWPPPETTCNGGPMSCTHQKFSHCLRSSVYMRVVHLTTVCHGHPSCASSGTNANSRLQSLDTYSVFSNSDQSRYDSALSRTSFQSHNTRLITDIRHNAILVAFA